jgi:hypothetical protein
MSLSGLWSFIIITVELVLIGAAIFLGIDFVVAGADAFKRIAKLVVGGALLLFWLFAIGAALGIGGGAQAAAISPITLLYLGIGIIALFLFVYIINLVIDWVPFVPAPLKDIIKLIVSAIAVIVMLVIAANALSGGGLMEGHHFRITR